MGATGAAIGAGIINPVAAIGSALALAPAIFGAVQANQAKQHAIGAAQAEETAIDSQITDATKQTADATKTVATQASGVQAAALAALKASLSATSGSGGTILTSPTGAAPAPTAQKTLLGL